MTFRTLAISLIGLTIAMGSTFAQAQQPAFRQVQTNARVPDENTLARLVWSTMVALDNANRTENYSVLYSLGAPEFQRRNSPDRLSALFSDLRRNRVDVGRAILTSPTYYQPPSILPDGSLRMRGGFDYRPNSIRFDLIYTNVGGGWRIKAISVVEMDAATPR